MGERCQSFVCVALHDWLTGLGDLPARNDPEMAN